MPGLPNTSTNIHLAIQFNNQETLTNGTRTQETGVDLVWGASSSGPPPNNYPDANGHTCHTYYWAWALPTNAPSNPIGSNPSWGMYRSDQATPATESQSGLQALDMANSAVQSWVVNTLWIPAMQAGFDGIAIDLGTLENVTQAAGHFSGSTWVGQYAGTDTGDVAWMNAQNAALASMRALFKASYPNAPIVINEPLDGGFTTAQWQSAVANVDVIGDEEGFTAYGGSFPYNTGSLWLTKVQNYVDQQKNHGKALMLVNQEPYTVSSYMTDTNLSARADLLWVLANYLLVKYSQTYLSWTGSQQYGPPIFMQTEYGAQIGSAKGDYYQLTGTTGATCYTRDFTNGKVIVNPDPSASSSFTLPTGVYKDTRGVAVGGAVTLGAHAGMVLIGASTGGGGGQTGVAIPLGLEMDPTGCTAPCYPPDQYIQQFGKAPALLGTPTNYTAPFPTAALNTIASYGATPYVALTADANTPATGNWASIASGAYDTQLTAWATAAASWGKPLLIRFLHEMDGSWYAWGYKFNAGSQNTNPQDFINAWRHVRALFTTAGATNCKFVYCAAGVGWANSLPYAQWPGTLLYPGDAYVDYIGCDQYNTPSPSKPQGNTWLTFKQVWDNVYPWMCSLSATLPLMISETGCPENTGTWGSTQTKAQWLTTGFLTDIPTSYPRVQIAMYFNVTTAPGTGGQQVETSSASIASWQQIVQAAYYQASYNTAGGGGGGPATQPQPTGPTGTWTLIFDDEFTGSALSTTSWHLGYPNMSTAGSTGAPADGSADWKAPSQVTVSGGSALLTAINSATTQNGTSYATQSGMLSTGKLDALAQAATLSFTYGCVEVRAQFPAESGAAGFWPRIWLAPTNETALPVIDLVDGDSANPKNALMEYQYLSSAQPVQDITTYVAPTDLGAAYHVYTVVWSPSAITWYIDGVQQKTFTTASAIGILPMSLYLALNVNGTHGTPPGGNAVWPAVMSIDYVRVWQSSTAGGPSGGGTQTGSNLVYGTQYGWKVRQKGTFSNVQQGSWSPWSSSLYFTPVQPAQVTITSVTSGGITSNTPPVSVGATDLQVAFSATSPSGNPFNAYGLTLYAADGVTVVASTGSLPTGPNLVSGGSMTSLDWIPAGMSNGATYMLAVSVTDAVTGAVSYSPQWTLNTSWTPPQQVTALSAFPNNDAGTVLVTWGNPTSGPTVGSVVVQRQTQNSDGTWGPWVTLTSGQLWSQLTDHPVPQRMLNYQITTVGTNGVMSAWTQLPSPVMLDVTSWGAGIWLWDPATGLTAALGTVDSWDALRRDLQMDVQEWVPEGSTTPLQTFGLRNDFIVGTNTAAKFFLPSQQLDQYGNIISGDVTRDTVIAMVQSRNPLVYRDRRFSAPFWVHIVAYFDAPNEDVHTDMTIEVHQSRNLNPIPVSGQ